MRFLSILLLAALAATLWLAPHRGGSENPVCAAPLMRIPAGTDSLEDGFTKAVRALSSPALEQRKAARRLLQQRGYAGVVSGMASFDAAWALASLARMNAQIEFHMSHRPLMVYVPVRQSAVDSTLPPYLFMYRSGPVGFALADDWAMPEDPWK